MLRDKLVTLFGGGGFVGRYLVQELLTAGARVRVAQRDPRQAYFIKPLGGLGQTQVIAADVRRPETVAHAIHGADAVVNLVGVLTGDYEGVQARGAATVARAAADAGVITFVHFSAIGSDPASPSRYGRSKGEGEAAVREAVPTATILRPSVIFGREDQFVNRFAALIQAAPVVPVLRAGTRFQPVDVVDVARAARMALAAPERFGGQVFELGGPDVITMSDLLHWIADAIGRKARFVELPDVLGVALARAGFLPGAPITWDQWLMLQRDNVVASDASGFAAFGITPGPLAATAPEWLTRYRKGGRFGRKNAELTDG